MKLVYEIDKFVAQWVTSRLGYTVAGPYVGIAVMREPVKSEDDMLAGVVYSDFQPDFGTMQVSMAADNPMWARKVGALLSYPFEQAGVFKLWAAVKRENYHALRTFKHIGFRAEATLAHQFGQRRHAVILRMLRPQYHQRYGAHHGQERAEPAAAA